MTTVFEEMVDLVERNDMGSGFGVLSKREYQAEERRNRNSSLLGLQIVTAHKKSDLQDPKKSIRERQEYQRRNRSRQGQEEGRYIIKFVISHPPFHRIHGRAGRLKGCGRAGVSGYWLA